MMRNGERLMHRSHLLEFDGKSYRLKVAATRLAQPINQLTVSTTCPGKFGWPKVGEFEVANGVGIR